MHFLHIPYACLQFAIAHIYSSIAYDSFDFRYNFPILCRLFLFLLFCPSSEWQLEEEEEEAKKLKYDNETFQETTSKYWKERKRKTNKFPFVIDNCIDSWDFVVVWKSPAYKGKKLATREKNNRVNKFDEIVLPIHHVIVKIHLHSLTH